MPAGIALDRIGVYGIPLGNQGDDMIQIRYLAAEQVLMHLRDLVEKASHLGRAVPRPDRGGEYQILVVDHVPGQLVTTRLIPGG
jgi:hypothetical protein